ncbi:hypothetical protein N7G274_000831 [Stereocaulon virgatum]|uniref:Uncharacterized protein n=1 Tax=Stereocaulon virgatum TaxID=373712 RepID=A0ABR4AM41_9LECA
MKDLTNHSLACLHSLSRSPIEFLGKNVSSSPLPRSAQGKSNNEQRIPSRRLNKISATDTSPMHAIRNSLFKRQDHQSRYDEFAKMDSINKESTVLTHSDHL